MTEKICNLLKLNTKSGLGLRVAESELKQDENDPNLIHILPKDNVAYTFALAHALSIQCENALHSEKLRFSAVRIMACNRN